MLVKSYDLNGIALDWAVAKAKNEDPQYNRDVFGDVWQGWTISEETRFRVLPNYSKNGSKVSYLQEELKISVVVEDDDPLPIEDGPWTAAVPGADWKYTGPTALIAICRCYVVNKLGEDIEIPNELLKA